MKKLLGLSDSKTFRENLPLVSFLFSLAMLIVLFRPLLSPLLNSRLEFAYGDLSSIISANSGVEKYQIVYYAFSQRWGALELHINRRFLLEGSISALSNLIPITDSQIVSIAILVSIVLGCYGIFRLVSLFVRNRGCRALLAPTLTLFYYLNLWSAGTIVHIWLWVAYAIFPLYLYFGLAYILNRNLRHLVIYSLLFAIYGIIPHNFIYMLIIHMFLAISSIFLADRNMKRAKNLLLFIGGPMVIYSLLNMPALLLLLVAEGLKYPIAMSIDQLSMLSRHGNLINIFTFSNFWWPKVPVTLLENPLFRTTSLLLFAFVFSTVVFAKRTERGRKALGLLSLVFVIGLIFFIQGTNNPFLLNIIHLFGRLGYIDVFAPFREWGRLSILIPVFSVIMSIGLASLRGRKGLISTLLLLTLVTLNVASSPSLVYINEVYSPTYIPLEYYNLSEEIPIDHKVLWVYPSSAKSILGTWRYVWNEQKAISQNLERSIGSTYNIDLEYVKMLSRKEAPQQLLNALNIKYVIKRTDILGASNFRVEYSYLSCKKLDYLTVCENPYDLTPFYVPASLILSDLDGENFYSVLFPSISSYIAVITEPRSDVIKVAQAVLSDFDSIWLYGMAKKEGIVLRPWEFTYFHNPERFWSRASTADLLHAGWHPYLERFGMENWQSDYGEGLVFTWAPSKLKENPTPTTNDLINRWAFNSINDLDRWKTYNRETQFGALHPLTLDNNALKAELWNSTWGWKTINSPLIPAEYGNWYRWELQIKGENTHKVHIKIVEYNQEQKIINARQVKSVGSGNFDWNTITIDYTPEKPETKQIQLQIWHGHETTQPLPNKIWIKNIKIYDLQKFTEPVTLEIPFTLPETDEYILLTRLFQNHQGGKIQIQLGNNNYIINTKDQLNKFVWKQIDTMRLEKGSHKITLTNIEGFNAINLFALIPKQEYQDAQRQLEQLLQDKRIIHILEAETDLYHQNSTISNKYGGEASNGIVLELNQTSKVWNEIDIIKPGNYALAIRAKGTLNIKIGERQFAVNSTQLDWIYLGPITLEKGKHTIEITNPMQPYYQWSFENDETQDWQINAPTMQTLTIDECAYEGKYSLLAKLNASAWGWKVISSPLIPVTPEIPYQWDFYVAGENAHAVHFKIAEYEINKTLLSATRMPGWGSGNFTWTNINFDYTPSQNASYIQLQIWHGHETTQPLPNKVWVDNVKVYDLKGYQPSDLDVVWLYSTQNENETLEDIFTPNEIPAEVISYQKIDPTKYVVKVNATKPFMLSFAEAYDPLWIAHVNGERIESIPLYSVINGFWINQTGLLEITIEYEPQKWFYYGSVISITTLLGSVAYLMWDWKKKSYDGSTLQRSTSWLRKRLRNAYTGSKT